MKIKKGVYIVHTKEEVLQRAVRFYFNDDKASLDDLENPDTLTDPSEYPNEYPAVIIFNHTGDEDGNDDGVKITWLSSKDISDIGLWM